MIKINLDSIPKDEKRYSLTGSVEVSGDVRCVAEEIYYIIKNFERNVPVAMEMGIERRVNELSTNWRKNDV